MAVMDTSALIDLGNGNRRILEAIEKAGGEHELVIPAPAVFELSAGSPAGLDESRRRLVGIFTVLPFTSAHAEQAGNVFRQLKNKGREIGALDAMIAGMALVEKQPVITANAKHFSRVEGLEVITY